MEGFDFSGLASYGAMGVCLIYFIVKDFTVSKNQNETNGQVRDAIHSLKEVVKVLVEVMRKP